MKMNRIVPDGFAGALMAVESFSDGRAVLHGPGGCRNYHNFMASRYYPRANTENPDRYAKRFFFGQSRLPCTYVDERDYIYGSHEKIEESLPVICSDDDSFLVFIRSPGAALIGDNITDIIDRLGYSDRAMAVESRSYPSRSLQVTTTRWHP